MKNKIKSLSLFLGIFLFLSITPSLFENGDAEAACIPSEKLKQANSATGIPSTNTEKHAACLEIGGKNYSELTCNTSGTSSDATHCLIDKDYNMLSKTICNALGIIKGKGGKAFAAFAVIAAGIGFFSGKISWGLLIGVTCGIAIMFGSATIVTAISGSSSDECP